MNEKIKNEILEKLNKDYYNLYDYFLSECEDNYIDNIKYWVSDMCYDAHNFKRFVYTQNIIDFVNDFDYDIYCYFKKNNFVKYFTLIDCLCIDYVYEQIGKLLIESIANDILEVLDYE